MPKSRKRKNHKKKVVSRNESIIADKRAYNSQVKVMDEIDRQARMDALNSVLLEQLEDHESGKVIIQDKEYLSKLMEFANSLNSKDVTKVEI
jgi:hypothetical protein